MAMLLIDAQALACPRIQQVDQASKREVLNYINRILDWFDISQIESVNFFSNDDVVPALFDEGQYPFWDELESALTLSGYEGDFQLQDINALLQALIQKSKMLEDLAEVDELEIASFQIITDSVSVRSPRYGSHVARTVAIQAIACERGTLGAERACLASFMPPVDAQIAIHATSFCLAADHLSVEEHNGKYYSLENHCGTKRFIENFDFLKWWEEGNERACTDALKLACFKSELSIRENEKAIVSFSFGSQFLNSAAALGFIHDRTKAQRLVRACRASVLGENLTKTHHLRENQGANSAQRMRGEFRAWRRDIDDEFHLHYWIKDDEIEFANVVTHNNFEITK